MAVTQELREKVQAHEKEHPNNFFFRELADKFGVPERDIVECCSGTVKVPREDFFEIWKEATSWEKCLFFVDHGNVVVECEGKLPAGQILFGGKLLNLHDHGAAHEESESFEPGECELGGHIYPEDLQSIYLVRRILYNNESLSIMFYDSGRLSMFGLYCGKENGKIIPSVRESFDKLWDKYSKLEGKKQ